MKLIVASQKDTAGSNMYDLFIKEFGFVKDGTYENSLKYKKDDFVLIKTDKFILDIEHINDDFQPELYICASKHQSEKKHPSLTAHTPGNWDKAEAGGSPKELCIAPACYIKKALNSLIPIEGFEITLEVTHHGPSKMNAPVIFVEVGSSEEEWQNLDACRSVCKAILALDKIEGTQTAVGFGGPHYAPNFTKLLKENKDISIGHICPKHYIDSLDEGMILQAFEKTVPRPDFALLDWKGLTGPQRNKLIEIFDKNKIIWKKIKELRNRKIP